VAYREEAAWRKRAAYHGQHYWARPVPGFGDPRAGILVVGLAPAAHGANRTGRMFTGDGPRGAGDFLMAGLHRAGLANQSFSQRRGDGLVLQNVYLTAVVRCAPPQNRPTSEEIRNCIPFLEEELRVLPNVGAIVTLGRVAFLGTLTALEHLGYPRSRSLFAHGQTLRVGPQGPLVIASYHPSRQNTQTGRLTPGMLDAVLNVAVKAQEEGAAGAAPSPESSKVRSLGP